MVGTFSSKFSEATQILYLKYRNMCQVVFRKNKFLAILKNHLEIVCNISHRKINVEAAKNLDLEVALWLLNKNILKRKTSVAKCIV